MSLRPWAGMCIYLKCRGSRGRCLGVHSDSRTALPDVRLRGTPGQSVLTVSQGFLQDYRGQGQEMNSLGGCCQPGGIERIKAPASCCPEEKFCALLGVLGVPGPHCLLQWLSDVPCDCFSPFPSSSLWLPGLTSHINYLHQSPCLGVRRWVSPNCIK